MLDKLLGKKQKGIQLFNLPQKKYCMDQKKLLKMDRKQLTDVLNDMQKHIVHLSEKLQLGRKQYERSLQRCQQFVGKSNVLNIQMSRISNEHEQLQVKFTNLQNSLELMIQDRESMIQSQSKYIQQHGFSKQKIKDFSKIFHIYQLQIINFQKITQQNKQLKQKIQCLQSQYHDLSQKYNEVKLNSVCKQQLIEPQLSDTHEDSEKEDQKIKCGQCLKLQHIIQGKQQIIVSLNKQILTERQKLLQNSDKIEQLNSDLEQIFIKISSKDDQLTKLKQQNADYLNLINGYKKSESKYKAIQQKNKEQLLNLNKSLTILQKEVNDFNLKVEQLENEKKLMSQKNYKKLAQTQQLYNSLNKQYEQLKFNFQRKEIQMQNLTLKLNSYQSQIVNLPKLGNQIQGLKNQLQRERQKCQQLKKKNQSIQQEYQIKLKKIQFSANQQRIKSDGLKRSLSQIEAKDQQNRKNLDNMYENKILQDGKIVQMQKKLKQYKHLIQYLRKQKIQLEKTFQSKIKNMQQMVINQVEQQEQPKQSKSAGKQINNLFASPKIVAQEQFQRQIISQKKIAVLQQQIDMLKEQNMNLRTQKQQLIQANVDMQDKLRSLTQKREQVMRQIKKMSSINNSSHHQKLSKQKQNQTSEGIKSKQKKIAQKAYKGFDILAKLLSTLYKQFINIHLSDIARKEVKQIESSINSIVRKSLDMKDIFQDYI